MLFIEAALTSEYLAKLALSTAEKGKGPTKVWWYCLVLMNL